MEKIFKAKRIDNGEWVVFELDELGSCDGETVHYQTGDKLDLNNACQYTGINAKNGRIFEGDELSTKGEIDSIAVWKNSSFCIKHKTIHSSFVKFSDIDLGCYNLTGHSIHDKD